MSYPARGTSELPIHPFLRDRLRDVYKGNLSKMAEACMVTPTMMSKWTTDDPRRQTVPSPASCLKMARAFRVEPDYLLSLAGHREGADAPAQLDPRLAAFLSQIEAAWQVMDDQARAIAERTGRALFHVPPISTKPRVTKGQRGLGRDNDDGSASKMPRRALRTEPRWRDELAKKSPFVALAAALGPLPFP